MNALHITAGVVAVSALIAAVILTNPRTTLTQPRRADALLQVQQRRLPHHFRVVALPGLPLQVTNQSLPDRKVEPNNRVGLMGCPSCGVYGKIKTSFRRPDAYWRRHQCPACGPYFTCQPVDPEMGITIHKKMKTLHPIDNN